MGRSRFLPSLVLSYPLDFQFIDEQWSELGLVGGKQSGSNPPVEGGTVAVDEFGGVGDWDVWH